MRKQKIIPLISLFFFGLFFVSTHIVNAEVIKNFSSTITVNTDSTILVKDNIIYDFEGVERHGIYRTIPLKNYKNKSTEIKVVSVTDENNNSYNFTENISNNELTIKIGDVDKLVSGVKEYDISYQVSNAVGYFDKFDEIYWNVTGNEWQVQIENASASVVLPNGVSLINKSCYYGQKGENNKCEISESNIFTVKSLLEIGDGLTIALSFPKGVVKEPTKFENIISIILDNIILILPILVFVIMFLIWRKKGKDPKGYSTIIAQYEPPIEMKPTLVGSLVDEKADFRDITAGIIYLAEQGFIKITKIEKDWIFGNADYEFKLIKNDISSLEKTENNILELLFTELVVDKIVKISDFKNDILFKTKINLIISDIHQEMTDKGFYERNPNNAKLPYLIVPFIFTILFLFILGRSKFIVVVSVIVSAIIIFIFGLFMSKRTKLGSETKDYILGFKLFLELTEKDRLDFHNAPEKKPEKFMQFLPYAVALGVEKKWAKQFEGIYIKQPFWYNGGMVGPLVITDFVSHISNFSESFNANIMSGGIGSGGGGFSGGGGGGGGGGSW